MYNKIHGKGFKNISAFKVSGSSLPSNAYNLSQKELPDFISFKVPSSNRFYTGTLASFLQEDRKRLKNARSVWPDNGRPDERLHKSGEGVFQESKSPEIIETATIKEMFREDEYPVMPDFAPDGISGGKRLSCL